MALELHPAGTAGTDVLDIHAGGVDLIFPHHEDEIAQSCAYTGQDAVRPVLAARRVPQHRGEKMSKRFGNITTARDLREDGVDPGAVRLLMFQVHYRQQLDLTDEALASAREGSRRLGEFQNRLLAAAGPSGRAGVRRGGRRGSGASWPRRWTTTSTRPRAVAALFALRDGGQRGARRRASAPGPRRWPPGSGPKACSA